MRPMSKDVSHHRTLALASACAAALTVLGPSAHASGQTRAWTGAGPDALWTDALNWANHAPPDNNGLETADFPAASTPFTSNQNSANPFALAQLSFERAGTLSGNAIQFGGATATITQGAPAAVAIQNNLALAGTLTVQGSGDLNLTGQLSLPGSPTAGLVMNGTGTLTLSGIGSSIYSLNAASGTTHLASGGALTLTSAVAPGSGTPALNVGANLNVDGGAALNTSALLEGSIAGTTAVPANFAVSGGRTLWQMPVNTFVGNGNAGNLILGSGAAATGGTLLAVGEFGTGSVLINRGSLTAATVLVGGTNGSFTVTGATSMLACTTDLSLDDSSTANLTVAAGGAVTTPHVGFGQGQTQLTVNAGTLAAGALQSVDGGTGALSLLADPAGGVALAINAAGGSSTYVGTLAGPGSILKTGGSTQVLGGMGGGYSGAITIAGGTLALNRAGGAIGPGASVTVNSGGVLQLGTAGGASDVLGTFSAGATLPAITVNAGALLTTGMGTSHNLGPLTLAGGTVAGDPAPTLGVGDYVLDGAVTQAGTIPSSITASGGVSLRGTIPFNVASTGTAAPGLTISASLQDLPAAMGGLTKGGPGALVLAGGSTYSGPTTINQGTLVLDHPGGTLGGSTTITVNAGTTLQLGAAPAHNNVLGLTLGSLSAPAIVVNAGGTLINAPGTTHNVGAVTLAGGTWAGDPKPAAGSPDYTLYGNVAQSGPVPSQFTAAGGAQLTGPVTFTVAPTGKGSPDLTVSAALADQYAAAGAITKSGAGTMLLAGANTYSGGTTVTAGTLLIPATAALPANGAIAISGGKLQLQTSARPGGIAPVASSLSISGSGTLDLTNNSLSIAYGAGVDPDAAVRTLIASGYNGGKWTGTGITSSAAAANPTGFAVGYADQTSSQTESIEYTRAGDATLDGTVNVVDLGILATNFGKTAGASWSQGDFNYDGKVDVVDLGILATNFGAGTAMTAAEAHATFLSVLKEFPQLDGIAVPTPEPAAAAMVIVVGAASLAGRRRGRRR